MDSTWGCVGARLERPTMVMRFLWETVPGGGKLSVLDKDDEGEFSPGQRLGAAALVDGALRLSTGDLLLILYQNEYQAVAQCIEQYAAERDIEVRKVAFQREEFLDGYPPRFEQNLITRDNPKGIALLMEWSSETTKGRLDLLQDLAQSGQKWRIASMPGVDIINLPFCAGDVEEINRGCRRVFGALARAQSSILRTPNPAGGMDELKIKFKGMPILSSGKIEDGQWGNVPSGETFILPVPRQAFGWVTIRGSIPRRPLEKDEWVRFELVKGRIRAASMSASSIHLQALANDLCFKRMGRVKFSNANALAELGIGVNSKIKYLTGNPVFDEKMSGTVHLGFGRNTQFGGPLMSPVHHDLVCTGSTLILSNEVAQISIVADGSLRLDEAQFVPRLGPLDAIDLPYRRVRLKNAMCKCEFVQIEEGPEIFRLEYLDFRNQTHEYDIAFGPAARLCINIVRALNKSNYIDVGTLRRRVACTDEALFTGVIVGLVGYQILSAAK
jgi:hypothetical protein